MNRITIHPPETSTHTVAFRWMVEPPTPLYHTTSFSLRFPEAVDLSRIPDRLWWTAVLTCLHSHWPLLRPCRVHLPVSLGSREVEFWIRLVNAEAATLDTLRDTPRCEGEIEISDGVARVEPLAPIPNTGRCATAFSSGKDSLLQAGLLAELTRQPVLVTTTSPMPPLEEHGNLRRRQVLAEIGRRRDVTLVEVQSDYRTIWEHEFPASLGYQVNVNEISDNFLYFVALMSAGVALGATHLFLASENEVQENTELDGQIVQFRHYMYSAVTQRALQALLAPAGLRYSSLTSSLHSFQVQQLLWTRYADLRDLQYSCWRVKTEEAACNQCNDCLRLAMVVLALGDTPARMRVDLVRLLWARRRWRPRVRQQAGRPPLPGDIVGNRLDAQTSRAIAATPLRRVAKAIAKDCPARLLSREGLAALLAYARLRRRIARYPAGDPPGYRAGFLRLVDPLLRERVGAIFDQHFTPEAEATYADMLAGCDALTRQIVDPMGGEA